MLWNTKKFQIKISFSHRYWYIPNEMKEEDRRERARRRDEMCLWTACDGGHSTTLPWGRPTPPASACPATATPSWWPGSAGSNRLHQGHGARDISFVYFNTQPISSISETIHSPMSLVMTWGSCVVHKSHIFLYQDNAMFGVIPWLRICMSMSYTLLFLESDMITVHSWAAVSCPAALVSLALCLSWQRYERSHGAGANWNRGGRVSSHLHIKMIIWIFIETKEYTKMSFD